MLRRASSVSRSSESLARRRRLRRRRALLALIFLLCLLALVAIHGLRQESVRISHVEVYGTDASLADIATNAIQGSYLGSIPRDSIFFFPESDIRSAVLASDPRILAVSISREGFTGLTIKVAMRVAVGRWCGLAPTPGEEAHCYMYDANGLIYAPTASTTETINPFILYTGLVGDAEDPLGAVVESADRLPTAFDFARQLATLGSPVTSITIRDGEVDNYLKSGTRITYLLGDEQNALTALVSARENFNLADGSIDYIDLRFEGRVYLKREE